VSQQVNLFSPVFLQRKKIFSFRTMIEALGLILLGSAGAYGYAWYETAALAYRVDAALERVELEQLRLARLGKEVPTPERTRQLEQELAQAQARLQARRQLSDALRDGGAPARGPSEHMRAFARQAMGGVWLTGFTLAPGGSGLALRGRALSPELVPAYLARLRREPVLQGGQFAALELSVPAVPASQSPPYVEFRLQAVKAEAAQ
jgi:hypothetical protein